MKSITYNNISDFDKDLRRLLKKFRSLEGDLEMAKLATIEPYHIGVIKDGVLEKKDSNAIFEIPNYCGVKLGLCSDELKICKIKKFACKALKGRGVQSGIRVIYVYYVLTNTVDFIEIYFKGESENENKERIKQYLDSI
jgi:hypothetical protein